MLADAGYVVKESSSGRQALELISSGIEIDVLVTRRLAFADQMPPLATSEVDQGAVRMLREWIAGMK